MDSEATLKSITTLLLGVAVLATNGCGLDLDELFPYPPDRGSSGISVGQKMCQKTGCSGHICSDRDVASTCEWREEYACYREATCELQTDGECGWTEDNALRSCRLGQPSDAGSPPDAGTSNLCFRGGCSGQLCSDRPDVASDCAWRPEYACYQQATCELQADGQCGFTPDETLTRCLAEAE